MTIKAYNNSKSYGVYCRQRAERITDEMKRAMEVTGNGLIRKARKLSSGAVSYQVMRRMDHPYARRHAGPKLNPAIINAHRGRFRAAWKRTMRVTPGRKGGEGITLKLFNDSDVARYMAGTKKMVHRPIIREIVKGELPEHRKAIRKATRRAIGQGFNATTAGTSGASSAPGGAPIGEAFIRGLRSGYEIAGAGLSGI